MNVGMFHKLRCPVTTEALWKFTRFLDMGVILTTMKSNSKLTASFLFCLM